MTLDDAPFILDHVNEPSFIENIRDSGVRSLRDAENYLRLGPVASYAKHGFGLMLIERAKDARAMGMCGLLQRDYLEHPDLGFSLDPPFRGKGYVTEAGRAVLAHAFDQPNRQAVLAITSPGNNPSAAVLSRLGFTFDEVMERPEGPVHRYILPRP